MKKLRKIMLVLSVVILNSCVANKETSDEFLVKKKDPLVLPPDFETLPLPNSKKKLRARVHWSQFLIRSANLLTIQKTNQV